jgi:hypothetical protein
MIGKAPTAAARGRRPYLSLARAAAFLFTGQV